MGARYRYVLDRERRLLAIEDLPRQERRTYAPFECIGCGKEMTAKLGNVLTHHFAHKVEGPCAGESYLHGLAKLLFVESYSRCLREGRPYVLSFTRRRRCNHFQGALGITCPRSRTERVDLTRTFDLVEPEGSREGFRADVLLESSRSDRRLFVEFVVTHESTPEKRSSGIPMVEVRIVDEEQAVEFARDGLAGDSPRVNLLNFRNASPRDVCGGDCSSLVDVFVVHSSGSCVLKSVSAVDAAAASFNPRALRKEILGRSSERSDLERPGIFIAKVREAHFDGLPVRNCYVCRHHGIGLGEQPIFCKAHREACPSNAAVHCGDFRPFRSREECDAAEQRNLAYVEKREEQWLEELEARTRRYTAQRRPSSESWGARKFIEGEKEWKRRHGNPSPDS